MNPIKKKVLIRIVFLAALAAIIFLYLFLSSKGVRFFCLIKENFSFECPACGATRAFFCFIKGDFAKAYSYNPVFTAAFYPIGIVLLLQDLTCCVCSVVKKREYVSIVDFMFGGSK